MREAESLQEKRSQGLKGSSRHMLLSMIESTCDWIYGPDHAKKAFYHWAVVPAFWKLPWDSNNFRIVFKDMKMGGCTHVLLWLLQSFASFLQKHCQQQKLALGTLPEELVNSRLVPGTGKRKLRRRRTDPSFRKYPVFTSKPSIQEKSEADLPSLPSWRWRAICSGITSGTVWHEIWNIKEEKRKDAFLYPPIHLLENTTIQCRKENTRGLSGPCCAAPFWVIWSG